MFLDPDYLIKLGILNAKRKFLWTLLSRDLSSQSFSIPGHENGQIPGTYRQMI
jgi:hypothetical protein